jgi:hypothetical protein
LDHLASVVRTGAAKTEGFATVVVGPTFFREPELTPDARAQEIAKAEAVAASLRALRTAVLLLGDNDRADGEETERRLVEAAGAAPASSTEPVVRKVGGLTFAFIGARPVDANPGARPLEDTVRESVRSAKAKGAQVFVVLATLGRGAAKRLADAVPELHAILLGSPSVRGEANTTSAPTERLGQTYVVEVANHGQSVGVLDFFVPAGAAPSVGTNGKNGADGALAFADGSRLELEQKRSELDRKIRELRGRIVMWENDRAVSASDVAARRADLERLTRERSALGGGTIPPGPFVRVKTHDVRTADGKDPTVSELISAYYKKVNEANRIAFKDRKPRPAPPGTARYLGVAACASCHEAPVAVWKKSSHATAYTTLTRQQKEFNLDCVSCHVTGYERPGGSTVTHVQGLEHVQCETCHGPGSEHVARGGDKSRIVAKPAPELCTGCHFPPHVHEFDPKAKMSAVLGPGHGLPL